MIGFSLKEPIDYKKICREIDRLIKSEVKNRKQAESTVLVIRLSTVTQVVENTKKIENKDS